MSFFSGSSETPDSSESSDQEQQHATRSRGKLHPKHHPGTSLRKKFGNSLPAQHIGPGHHPFNLKHMTQDMFNPAKQQQNSFGLPDDESSLDVSSPREINSPSFGLLAKSKDGQDKLTRKRDKQKAKEDEKMEKRRLKVREI